MTGHKLKTVLVTYPLEPTSLVDRLRDMFETVYNYPQLAGNDYSDTKMELPPAEVLAEAEVLFTFRLPDNLTHIDQMPNLKLLQTVGSGTAQVTESAFFRSIPPSHPLILSNSAGIHAQSIGEHIIMSLLMLQHRIAEPLRIGSQEKRWASPQELGGLHISELRGKVVGMLPYGAVSREVARMASAFGARIVACTREGAPKPHTGYRVPGTGDPDGSLPEKYYKISDKADFHQFLAGCDIVVNMLPSSAATRQLIGRNELVVMKNTAIFVNAGRGDTVDTEALVEALQAKPELQSTETKGVNVCIGAAVLDVTEPEPLPDGHILFDLKNVVLTPHCSWASVVNFHRATDLLEQNAERFAAGDRILNVLRSKQE